MTLLSASTHSSSTYNTTYQTEKYASHIPAPDDQIATVVAYVFDDKNQLALTLHPQRGWGLPGGHREAGETIQEAIYREVKEETSIEITQIKPIGYINMKISGEKPTGYPYPYPIRSGQVFAARTAQILPFAPIADALDRKFIAIPELETHSITLQYEDELLWLPYALQALGV